MISQLDFSQLQSQIVVLLCVLALSDFVPIICMIACIQIGNNGKWDTLLSAYLHGPHEDDLTTECGSHILDELYEKGSVE